MFILEQPGQLLKALKNVFLNHWNQKNTKSAVPVNEGFNRHLSSFCWMIINKSELFSPVFSSQKSGKPGKWWKSGNRLDPDHPFELIAGLPLLISHAFCYSPRNQFVDKAPKGHQINQNVQKISMISEYSSSTDQSEFPEDIPISFHIFLAFHARLITALRPEPREELCSALMIVSSRRSSRLKGEDEPQKKATLKEMYKSI